MSETILGGIYLMSALSFYFNTCPIEREDHGYNMCCGQPPGCYGGLLASYLGSFHGILIWFVYLYKLISR